MRINKYIAANSIYSRRKVDELIKSRKVSINGKTLKELGKDIDPTRDKIEVNNKEIFEKKEKIYLALNKPAGYISSRNDEHKRQTVMDLVPKIPNLKPVGRLDKNTEGLMLLSNDGEFINRFTHPKFECEKEYLVKVGGFLTDEAIKNLEQGIPIDDKKTSAAKIHIKNRSNKQSMVTITIHEGRNRQIRKMFAYLKFPVKYLQRIRIGSAKLGALGVGKFRHLTKKEIDAN